MRELVALLERNGFESVSTYIQSGNVVLQSNEDSSKEIETLIANEFGFNPKVLVLEKSEFESAVEKNPFNPTEGKSVHFYFCRKQPNLNLEKVQKFIAESEKYHLEGKVFYLYAPNGIGRSKLVANLESCLGTPATGRNLNTINKLSQMAENV